MTASFLFSSFFLNEKGFLNILQSDNFQDAYSGFSYTGG